MAPPRTGAASRLANVRRVSSAVTARSSGSSARPRRPNPTATRLAQQFGRFPRRQRIGLARHLPLALALGPHQGCSR